MLKILYGFDWLSRETVENTKEINECLEKGLIKYFHDEYNPTFIVLESKISIVKEILKDDYNKLNEATLIELIESDYSKIYEMEINNVYDDSIKININTIYKLILSDEDKYLTNDKKLEIYNANCPSYKLKSILDELGRNQAKIQIQSLLESIENQEFK